MANRSDPDQGTIQALMERLQNFRLPRALAIKARVDNGEMLQGSDIEFMTRVFEDANSAQPLVARHPEYQALVVKLVGLYDEITRKALENEQGKPSK